MNFHTYFRYALLLAVACHLACCNRLSETKIQEVKLTMQPIVELLNRKRPLPGTVAEFSNLCASEKVVLPQDLVYGRVDNNKFKIWRYVLGRTSLVYDNDFNVNQKGAWYLDFDDGTIKLLDP